MNPHDNRHRHHPRFHRPQRRFAFENLPELIDQADVSDGDRPEYLTGDEMVRFLVQPRAGNLGLSTTADRSDEAN